MECNPLHLPEGVESAEPRCDGEPRLPVVAYNVNVDPKLPAEHAVLGMFMIILSTISTDIFMIKFSCVC